jgi:hypothetical protein
LKNEPLSQKRQPRNDLRHIYYNFCKVHQNAADDFGNGSWPYRSRARFAQTVTVPTDSVARVIRTCANPFHLPAAAAVARLETNGTKTLTNAPIARLT